MTDNGSPRLSDARSFTVTVAAAAPVLVDAERDYFGTARHRRKLIGVQLDFSAPLDPGAASAAGHFRVTQPGPARRSGPTVVRPRRVVQSGKPFDQVDPRIH